MTFKKGESRPKNAGRKKGSTNKATDNAKAAIAAFVDGNAPRLESLLDKIESVHGPKAAFDSITSLLEYHMPKLSRADINADLNATVQTVEPLTKEEAIALDEDTEEDY